jgi:hypothetical protein
MRPASSKNGARDFRGQLCVGPEQRCKAPTPLKFDATLRLESDEVSYTGK